ncbi:MAG: tetratricopeptide repeat protein [bacterium]
MSANQITLEQVAEGQYRFHYPNFVNQLDDMIFDAVDLMDADEYVKAKDILHSIIDTFPEHMDAMHHLAVCLKEQGEFQVAFNLWQQAVDVGLKCFPHDVPISDMRLEWGWLENRPFLRAYESLGVDLYEQDRLDEALDVFNHILSLNPNDNQGIRALAIKANFDLERPQEVLDICDRFPEDALADTFYGRLLALYQLNRLDRMEQTLKEAIEFLPVIAQELVKKRHTEFDNLLEPEFDDEQEEAIYYWENYGQYWRETKGAIKFLKDGLSKYA